MTGIQIIFISLSLLLSLSLLSLGSCSPEKPVAKVTREGRSSKAGLGTSSTTARGEAPGTSGTSGKDGGSVSKNRLLNVTRASIHLDSKDDGDFLRVVPEGSGPDGHTLTYIYEWSKNGEPAGNSDSLSGFKRGDRISVKITPFDGKEYGQPKTLTTEIKNTCPRVIGQGEVAFDGKVLACQIKAIDLDSDVLSYVLVEPPKGMSINKNTGEIKWNVPPEYHGRQEVKVKVLDGQGGEALYPVVFDVTSVLDQPVKTKR